jgi:chemotaxis protein methyltransferase CheR
LLLDLSVSVTAMFRDPGFYQVFRQDVVPLLRTYPFIRIWHAGCSTGEEVYSTAIVLEEEGLLDRTRIYATDINAVVLRASSSGIFPLTRMQEYTENYIRAEVSARSRSITQRCTTARCSVRRSRGISCSRSTTSSPDRSFSEFNVIFCRNVLIYFDRDLQNRVHQLFYESLVTFGFSRSAARSRLRRIAVRGLLRESCIRAKKLYRKISVIVAYAIVVVGTSWGGLARCARFVAALPPTLRCPWCRAAPPSQSDQLLVVLIQDRTPLCVA